MLLKQKCTYRILLNLQVYILKFRIVVDFHTILCILNNSSAASGLLILMLIYSTLPDQDELWSVFNYSPNKGILYWTNGLHAGGRTKYGYIRVKYRGNNYMVHRIIWKMVYGDDPLEIDHINNRRDDNRFINLRCVTRAQNQQNSKLVPHSSSGLKGVHWRKGKNWCVAQIAKDGVKYYLGVFYTAEEAHQAYVVKAKELFGEFANDGYGPCL